MATFVKVRRKQGYSWKVIIKRGDQVLKTKTFRQKAAAREWAKRVEGDNEISTALGSPGAKILFSKLADEYMAQWKGRDKSQAGRVAWWRKRLEKKKLTEIDAAMIREALDDYAAGKAQRGDGVGPDLKPKLKETNRPRTAASINRQKATISGMFKYAIQRGYLEVNPVSKVPARPENNKRTRYLSDEERSALLAACRASEWDRLYLLVLMALTTGARQGELLGLRWADIDLHARLARLHQTKNGEERVLTLPPVVIPELKRFQGVGQAMLFPSSRKEAAKKGRPFEFRKHWNAALEAAGIENFRFHDLRHSAASYLVMNGATLYEAAQVLGHKDLQTTQRYAHLSTQHKQDLTDRVMGAIFGESGA